MGLLCSHCFCVEWSGWCEIDQTDQRLPSLDNTPPPTHHHNHRPIIPTMVTVMLFIIMPMITRGRRRISLKRTKNHLSTQIRGERWRECNCQLIFSIADIFSISQADSFSLFSDLIVLHLNFTREWFFLGQSFDYSPI